MASKVNGLIRSASLILIGRNGRPTAAGALDYRTLFLRRTPSSRFHPGGLVFPGGALETDADFSAEWRHLFAERSIDISTMKPMSRDSQLTDQRSTDDLALRMCAIRETFEESGILLCNNVNRASETIYADLSRPDLEKWRDRVRQDASSFVELFRQHPSLLPCVHDLHAWSTWITPPRLLEQGGAGSNKRFITSFFTAFLSGHQLSEESPPTRVCGQPAAVVDHCEIVDGRWQYPHEVVDSYRLGHVSLMPPQVYELARIGKIDNFDAFRKFSHQRRHLGVADWMNVRVNCDDGLMYLLPGDELYPIEPDFEGNHEPVKMSGSIRDLHRRHSSRVHRIMKGYKRSDDDKALFSVHCNIGMENGHLSPTSEE